jgi:putative NADPH-quinone reductase
MTRILVLDGHPDPDRARFIHALADAYAEGAQQAGHAVTRIDIATLGIPPLDSIAFWKAEPDEPVRRAQAAIAGAEHLVILYPLWMGDVPAALKGFCEQVFRPGFAFPTDANGVGKGLLKGRTARIVVTMGMPSLVYRWWVGAHSLRSLERNLLQFVGIKPTGRTVIGSVEAMDDARRRGWLAKLRELGARAG